MNNSDQDPEDNEEEKKEERDKAIVEFRVSEETYDRYYEFIQKKQLFPLRDYFKETISSMTGKSKEV